MAKFIAFVCSLILIVCGVGGVFANDQLSAKGGDGVTIGDEPSGDTNVSGAGGENGTDTGEEPAAGGESGAAEGGDGSGAGSGELEPPKDEEPIPNEKPLTEKGKEAPALLEEAESLDPEELLPFDAAQSITNRAELDSAIAAAANDNITANLASNYTHSGGAITINTAFNFTIDGAAVADLGSASFDITQQGTGKITVQNMRFGAGSAVALKLTGSGADQSFAVESCSFNGRTANGLQLSGGPTATVKNCLFKDFSLAANQSAFSPGARSQVTITSSSFIDNVNSVTGGAAILIGNGTDAVRANLTIEACLFSGNKCTSTDENNQLAQGGAIRGHQLINSYLYLRDSVFENNETPAYGNNFDGGAVGIHNNNITNSPAYIEVTGCNFTGNRAGDDGGALLLEGAPDSRSLTSYVANCTFVGNQAGVSGYQNGTGGAIGFYALHDSTITHCTFYDNASNANGQTSTKSGGAVALDSSQWANIKVDPPVLSNNIFIANKDLGDTPGYGNIWLYPDSNAALDNNGNIGYDFDATAYPGYSQGEKPSAYITVANVFANKDSQGKPIREPFGPAVGQADNTAQRFCFIPSPRSDEMYRDGSGPFYDAAVRTDVRGYTRDPYPNAGAVEIYWTKFDPNIAGGGSWVGALPAGSISSLFNQNVFYLVTTPSSSTEPVGNVTTFPRGNITNSDTDLGFYGWKSNQPDTPGGSDFPTVQPGISVPSTKQHYTATWDQSKFRVDFDLQYSVNGSPQWAPPLLRQAKGATIAAPNPEPTRTGWIFGGWYKETATTNIWNFATELLTDDMTLYAKWTAQPTGLTVTYHPNGGAAPSFASKPVMTGTPYGAHPTTTRAGHSFLGWYTAATGGIKVESATTVTATSNHMLYAQWTPITYTVRFVDHDGTLLKAETVASGGNATPPANPSRSGYTFSAWSGIYTNVQSDQTVTATYSYNGGGGSTPTPPPTPVVQRPRTPTPTPAPVPEPEPESAPPAPVPVVTQPAPTPAPAPVPTPVIPEALMNDDGVPLGSFLQTDVWALLNLILVIAGILIAILRLLASRKQQADEENEADGTERRARFNLFVILALIVSVAALIVLLLLEDFSKPMAWINNHTPIIAVFFIVEMVLVVLSNVRRTADADVDAEAI